jgi:hypothetical protein
MALAPARRHSLTRTGRKALDVYKDALCELLDAMSRPHGSTF